MWYEFYANDFVWIFSFLQAANPYLTGMPQVGNTYSPYYAPGPIMPAIMGPDPTGVASPLSVVSQTVVQQKMPRSDRLEVSADLAPHYHHNLAHNFATAFYYEPLHHVFNNNIATFYCWIELFLLPKNFCKYIDDGIKLPTMTDDASKCHYYTGGKRIHKKLNSGLITLFVYLFSLPWFTLLYFILSIVFFSVSLINSVYFD